jgi:hypothetical protein
MPTPRGDIATLEPRPPREGRLRPPSARSASAAAIAALGRRAGRRVPSGQSLTVPAPTPPSPVPGLPPGPGGGVPPFPGDQSPPFRIPPSVAAGARLVFRRTFPGLILAAGSKAVELCRLIPYLPQCLAAVEFRGPLIPPPVKPKKNPDPARPAPPVVQPGASIPSPIPAGGGAAGSTRRTSPAEIGVFVEVAPPPRAPVFQPAPPKIQEIPSDEILLPAQTRPQIQAPVLPTQSEATILSGTTVPSVGTLPRAPTRPAAPAAPSRGSILIPASIGFIPFLSFVTPGRSATTPALDVLTSTVAPAVPATQTQTATRTTTSAAVGSTVTVNSRECEALRRRRKQGKCAEGFFRQYPDKVEFTTWREVDCFDAYTKRAERTVNDILSRL